MKAILLIAVGLFCLAYSHPGPAPKPKPVGPTSDCAVIHKVDEEDDCISIADDCEITLAELYALNGYLNDGNACTKVEDLTHVCCSLE